MSSSGYSSRIVGAAIAAGRVAAAAAAAGRADAWCRRSAESPESSRRRPPGRCSRGSRRTAAPDVTYSASSRRLDAGGIRALAARLERTGAGQQARRRERCGQADAGSRLSVLRAPRLLEVAPREDAASPRSAARRCRARRSRSSARCTRARPAAPCTTCALDVERREVRQHPVEPAAPAAPRPATRRPGRSS